ncbi:MAG: hypothetical protein IJ220_00440 [Clostridia bacterium]|nr:hypothetical protein [Clostridia bacterium]
MHYFNICSLIFVIVPATVVLLMQAIVIFEYGRKIQKVKQIRKDKVKLKRGKDLVYALFDTKYYLSTLDVPLLKKLTIE